MNREQRRAFSKATGRNYKTTNIFVPGDRVCLNMESISKNLRRASPAYREWVDAHKDMVFTVQTAVDFEFGSGKICSLEEDESEEKWLFHSIDLKPVE